MPYEILRYMEPSISDIYLRLPTITFNLEWILHYEWSSGAPTPALFCRFISSQFWLFSDEGFISSSDDLLLWQKFANGWNVILLSWKVSKSATRWQICINRGGRWRLDMFCFQ